MTDTRSTTDTRSYAAASPDDTAAGGWVVFAAMMLFLVGTFQFIVGLVALFNSDYYLVTSSKLVVHFNFTAWGWIHLVIGLVALLAGFGVLVAATWARVVGIALAGIGAIANLAFVGAYPVWGLTLITLDVLVIYALAVHGRELGQE